MTSFRPSNPVARSLIKLKPLQPDHPPKRSRAAIHSGITLPKVKPYPTLTLSNNAILPNNNKATQFENSLVSSRIASPRSPRSPRKIDDHASGSSMLKPCRPLTAPVGFRPIRKEIFSRVYPLCQTKRKRHSIEVPETDEHSDDEIRTNLPYDEYSSYIAIEPDLRRHTPQRRTSNAELGRQIREFGREISMSPLARVISSMPEI